ncbi:MAG: ATP-binding protein [Bacteroidota bacterium]|nr:ATP-binding protein [Bacteroidota bacterium]
MSFQNANPFPISHYMGPDTFCDREKETKTLVSGLENGQNFTLLSLRRIGKTGLIKHVLSKMTDTKSYFCLYIDIQFTQNQSEFAMQLAKEITKTFPIQRGIGRKFISAISNLRPKVSFDALSGAPELSLDVAPDQIKENTIQDILYFLDSQNVSIILAIDEFQQILKYPEQNTEAMLRATMQQVRNIRFLFCGSDQHLMYELFQSAKRPFFASCTPMYLNKIDNHIYNLFISEQFLKHKRNITFEAIELILNLSFTHTYYTQSICHHVFQRGLKKIDTDEVYHAMYEILKEYEPYYYQLKNLLTDAQWQLMKALAHETEVIQPYNSQFIAKYKLQSSAAVKRSLDSLLQKELIYHNTSQNNGYYAVYDKFLLRWMQRLL